VKAFRAAGLVSVAGRRSFSAQAALARVSRLAVVLFVVWLHYDIRGSGGDIPAQFVPAVSSKVDVMKILVPVDGSPASIRAVRFAIAEARVHPGASLLIVNVQNLSMLGLADGAALMPPAWIAQEEERAAQEALREAASVCSQSGAPHSTRSERGAVSTAIDRVAREEGVARIVMGTRGFGGVRGLVLGSVATQVLHLTDVPVTLVK
jgi:nucleotide-binding universal stress UspA family protein